MPWWTSSCLQCVTSLLRQWSVPQKEVTDRDKIWREVGMGFIGIFDVMFCKNRFRNKKRGGGMPWSQLTLCESRLFRIKSPRQTFISSAKLLVASPLVFIIRNLELITWYSLPSLIFSPSLWFFFYGYRSQVALTGLKLSRSCGWPWTSDLLASTFQVLWLQVSTIMCGYGSLFIHEFQTS